MNEKYKRRDPASAEARPYRRVGIRRGLGGWGDVQMSLAVAELWVRERGEGVTFGCPKELLPLCENVPGVEALVCRSNNADKEAPPGLFDELSFGRKWDITTPCIEYEKALQPHVDRNRPEIWATKLGLKGKSHPRVYLSETEQRWADNWIAEHNLQDQFILGIIPNSYSWARDWGRWIKVLYQIKQNQPLITPLIFLAGINSWESIEFACLGHLIYRPPIREMLALLSRCHLVTGMDTGPMHSAVGLGIPTLWLFTHIDGRIRTRGYEKAEVIQRTDLDCCPCWYEPQCHDPRYLMMCKDISVDKVMGRIIAHYQKKRGLSAHNVKILTGVTPQSGGGEKKLCSL